MHVSLCLLHDHTNKPVSSIYKVCEDLMDPDYVMKTEHYEVNKNYQNMTTLEISIICLQQNARTVGGRTKRTNRG